MNECTFQTDWFSMHIPVWETHLGAMKSQPDIHALEIGCFEGRATCWLLQNILIHPTARITCIDPLESPKQFTDWASGNKVDIADLEVHFMHNINAIGATEKVTLHKASSRDILPQLTDQFDVMYIDGSHYTEDVAFDAKHAWPLLKKKGICIFDDYLLHEAFTLPDTVRPCDAIDAFLILYKDELETLRKDKQVIVQKK